MSYIHGGKSSVRMLPLLVEPELLPDDYLRRYYYHSHYYCDILPNLHCILQCILMYDYLSAVPRCNHLQILLYDSVICVPSSVLIPPIRRARI